MGDSNDTSATAPLRSSLFDGELVCDRYDNSNTSNTHNTSNNPPNKTPCQ